MFNRLKEIFISVVKEKPASPGTTPEKAPKQNLQAHVVRETPRQRTSEREEYIEKVNVSMYFPLHQGDIIELRSGKKYQVCKKTITGAIENSSVSLLWINKPALIQEQDRVEQVRFTSMREMNYHLEKEKASIVHVKKCYKYKREMEISIEEAHDLAIEENVKRDRIKQFFTNISSKNN